MKIWVDADSCPSKVKEILYRAAERRHIAVVLVADRRLRFPDSPYVSAIQVTAGMDAADTEIVQQMKQGDLVITADIPLAAAVINAAGHALNPRGELYTEENIRSRLSMRDFLDSLRQTGIDTGGPSALSQRDHKQFADELDRFLSRHAAG